MARAPVEEVAVAVLGGGPAGAAAARVLALWGHRVVLLTRPPPGPPLAESLTPSCGKVLEQIGVLEAINRAGFVRSTGHTVRWGGTAARVETFAHGEQGWQVLRTDLDRVLLREAKAAGAIVRGSASVRRVVPNGDGAWRISYEERGRTRHVTAPWVIDCSGRSGLMSRAKSGRVPTGPRTIAVVGLWDCRPNWALADESHTHVESYPGGWAWSVPVSKTRRQVTVMLDPRRTEVGRGSRLPSTYQQELAGTTMIGAMIERARPIGRPWARDASPYESEPAARGRVLAAGDAASFVDPLSSYGVKKALASAWLAAVVVHSVVGDATLEEPALRLFATRERAMVAGLRRQLEQLSHEAELAHPTGFWGDRGGLDVVTGLGDPDVAALRLDADVSLAFDAIRNSASLALRHADGVRRERLPVVAGHTVSLSDHLVVPAFPAGIRYIRNVDLIVLADLAPRHSQVPELFDAYLAAAMPVPLPDFLGALAVLVGKGIVQFA